MIPLKLLLSLAAIAAAATMEQVLKDVSNINSDVEKLTKQVNAWDGGLISAPPQIAALGLVNAALDSGVCHTDHLPTLLSDEDSKALLDLVNVTLYVSNPIAIGAVLEKQDKYKGIGMEFTIATALKKLLNGHGDFAGNVVIRLPEEFLERGVDLTNHITLAIRKGILEFGG